MDDDLALIIGRNVNRTCPPQGGAYLKIREVAESIFNHEEKGTWHYLGLHNRRVRKMTWDGYCASIRQFLRAAQSTVALPDGSHISLPHFTHYPDLKRGHRWIRTAYMTRTQLGVKIVALRRQQRGYEARLQVYERIFDLLKDEAAIVGEVIEVLPENGQEGG